VDWKLFAQLLVTIIVALLGGWLGHYLAARRDLLNERRKLRITYLLEAYRKLEDAGNRSEPDRTWPLFESAIADIQLLGSPVQVELARTFALDMAEHHTASLDPLINDLRDSLRREMELQQVQETVVYLRFGGAEAVSFDRTLHATIRSVDDAKVEQAAVASPDARNLLERQETIEGNVGRMVIAWREIETILRTKLEKLGVERSSNLGVIPLLDKARQVNAITDAQHRSLRGLNAMRNLAVHGPGSEIDEARLREFLSLAEAMKVVLEITR
jgi:hypothetical protein